jgi:hypothetical protein
MKKRVMIMVIIMTGTKDQKSVQYERRLCGLKMLHIKP